MLRAWDAIIIASEADLDLLEARFHEYAELPVVHVVAEAPVTYDGKPKPLWFWENRKDRFRPWHGRWNHVRVEPHELPPLANSDAKARKDALREYLAHAVTADPDDIVLHGAIDEIPAAWAVEEILAGKTLLPIGTEMRWCCYRPGLVHPHPWRGTVAQQWKMTGSFAGLREQRTAVPALVNAGTRLSMQGQEEAAVHPDGIALREEQVDESWPRLVHARSRAA